MTLTVIERTKVGERKGKEREKKGKREEKKEMKKQVIFLYFPKDNKSTSSIFFKLQ